MNVITYQHKLRPVLDTGFGAKEYREFRQTLEEMDRILEVSGIEHRLLTQKVRDVDADLSARRQQSLYRRFRQAHERIIGERRVANKDKILSFYDTDVRVLVRGKAGAEVEFGNAMYLAEQSDGLIVDWDFIQEQAPGDNKLVAKSIESIGKEYGALTSYTADRGFDSPMNAVDLEKLKIINAICPRSVSELEKRLADETFCHLQKRRGATEARIGIFKNAYLGKPLKSKGFKNRKIRIGWCILSHNLWKLSTMAAQRRKEIEEELAETA
jgi:hypothetical protein